jgi:hypothetical protein
MFFSWSILISHCSTPNIEAHCVNSNGGSFGSGASECNGLAVTVTPGLRVCGAVDVSLAAVDFALAFVELSEG